MIGGLQSPCMNSCFDEDGMIERVGAYNHTRVYLNMKGKRIFGKFNAINMS